MRRTYSRMRRRLFFAFGFVMLVLGIIGLFLPILPTTPFLLLTAWAWMNSSARFYTWLINSRVLGTYIENYREKRGITLLHKTITLTLLWIGIAYAAFFVSDRLWLTVSLLVIAVGVSIHLLMLKTLPVERKPDRLPPPGE